METTKLFGPPGTGKTTRLLRIVEQELQNGTPPDRIAYMSHTNAACDEARERAMAKFDLEAKDLPWFCTMHAACLRLGSGSAATLITGPKDLKEFVELSGYTFTPTKDNRFRANDPTLDAWQKGATDGDKLFRFDHYRRARMLSLEDAYHAWAERLTWYDVVRFTKTYAQWKDDVGAEDFTDLLTNMHLELEVDVVIIDEAQDLSAQQWETLNALTRLAKRLYVAGDDDQAIFTWGGASPERFIAYPGKVDVLDQSFRLPRQIHQHAQRFIMRLGPKRQAKVFKPRDADGAVYRVNTLDQAIHRLPKVGTVAFLYRNHYLATGVERWLRRLGQPYSVHGKPASGLQYGPAIVLWERWRKGRELTVPEVRSVLRAMQHPAVNAVKTKLKSLQDDVTVALATAQDWGLTESRPWMQSLTKLKPWMRMYLQDVIRKFGVAGLREAPRFNLSTIHASKGTEADHVVMLTETSKKVTETINKAPDSERRVFYVGMTRAKHTLTLVGSKNRMLN